MSPTRTQPSRWILAFDASCGSCRQLAGEVEKAASGKLEIMPLRHPDAEAWRRDALGVDAPWQPTLIQVGAGRVRAWTGKRMALRITRRIGLVASLRLLRALGSREQAATLEAGAGGLSRKGFLRLGAGAGVAAGVILSGKVPAFAQDKTSGELATWLAANRGNLPRDYATIVSHPMAYRRAIHSQLPASVRTELWLEHLRRYRAGHPSLSAEQAAVIGKTEDLLANQRLMHMTKSDLRDATTVLHQQATAAFGRVEAGRAFAILGAPSSRSETEAICACSTESDYCPDEQICKSDANCERVEDCGFLWAYVCNGFCNWA